MDDSGNKRDLLRLNTPEQDERYRALGRELLDLLPSAVTPRLMQVAIGDWRPEPRWCSTNAQVWVDNNEGWSRVRGFTYASMGDLYPFIQFSAHNVVRSPAGELIDITPDWATDDSLFLAHRGANEEHDEILRLGGALTVPLTASATDAELILEVAGRLQFWVDKAKQMKESLDRGEPLRS